MGSLSLLQSLHENLSSRAQVKSVFGEPIVAADKTVIPVARVAYGFGAGAGTGGVGEQRPVRRRRRWWRRHAGDARGHFRRWPWREPVRAYP